MSGSPAVAGLWQGSVGVPQRMQAGSPEGCNPTGRSSEGVPQRMQAGSPEGCNLSGRRNGGCASINSSSLLSPFLPGRGPGGWSEHPAPTQGIQRSAALWEGSEGVPQRMQAGSPEGCNLSGRRNGGCASINSSSLLSPFLPGRMGPLRGDGPNTLLQPRESSGAPPFGRGLRVSPAHARGVKQSRGVQPHWQEEWRMCLHKHHLYFPPSFQEGGQGDGPNTLLQPRESFMQERGLAEWGCASRSSLLSPFLLQLQGNPAERRPLGGV